MKKGVVFVISGKNPVKAPGGYAAYSHNLCKALKNLEYDVRIIALGNKNNSESTEIGQLYEVSNVIANKIPFITLVQMSALPFYSYSFAKRIEKIINQEKVNSCIVWGIGPWGLAELFLKQKYKHKMKLVLSYFTTFLHEMSGSVKSLRIKDYGFFLKTKYILVYYLLGPAFSLMEKTVVNSANLIITHYKSSEEILAKEFGTPSKKFRRITYYTEIFKRRSQADNLYVKRNIENKHPLILTICRQDPRKGINFLLHAVRDLITQGYPVNVLIIGVGNMLQHNKKLAQRLGIAKYVYFLGFVNDSTSYLNTADVYVSSAVEEGGGSLSLLEAMSAKIPIVTTDCDGIPEDIQHDISGIIVNKMDSAGLAKSLRKVLTDKRLADSLAKNAKNAYMKKFSMKKMQDDIQTVLRKL